MRYLYLTPTEKTSCAGYGGRINPYNGRESERDAHTHAGNGDINSRPHYVAQIRLSALYASIYYVVCLL
jgi:hypothetical protein